LDYFGLSLLRVYANHNTIAGQRLRHHFSRAAICGINAGCMEEVS
jgi:hypothetical protein